MDSKSFSEKPYCNCCAKSPTAKKQTAIPQNAEKKNIVKTRENSEKTRRKNFLFCQKIFESFIVKNVFSVIFDSFP
jgi:hypothetical protein